MTYVRKLAFSGVLVAALLSPHQTAAASKWECAIWLCAPVGFALPNCDKAFKAMRKRIAKFKSPVPSWGSCAVKDDDVSRDVAEETGIPQIGAAGQSGEPSAEYGYVHTNPFNGEALKSERRCIEYPLVGGVCSNEMFIQVTGEGIEAGQPFKFEAVSEEEAARLENEEIDDVIE